MSYSELLEKENITQSKYSPGLIEKGEILSRVLFSPKHFKDDKILPTAFDPEIFSGLSVLREKFNFEQCLTRTITLLQKDNINNFCGYVSANVSDIQNIKHENYRIFYVVDTATEDRIGHADVCAIRVNEIGLPNKALKSFIRYEISLVFNKLHLAS